MSLQFKKDVSVHDFWYVVYNVLIYQAVGDWENTVKIYSLDPDNCLQSVCVQGLPAHPESLSIIQMATNENAGALFLNIGLNNGVLLRSVLDPITGELSDTRTRYSQSETTI